MKQKNKIKKYFNKKAHICYLQILILIIGTFAFSYLIYQSSVNVNEIKSPNNVTGVKNNTSIVKIIKLVGLLILQKIKEPILPMVSAQENALADWACCEKNNNGAFCTYRPKSECNANFGIAPNQCGETTFCKSGCCIGSSGICSANTPKTNCNGAWFEQAFCNIQNCERACCILGNQAKFTTEKNCEIESGFLGIPVDFKTDVRTEVECLYLTEKDDEGACVFQTGEETTCLFITREECLSRTGNENNFYKNTFCSSPELNASCATHDYDGCAEGEDGVYWYDSCGNREEVKEPCSIFLGTRCGQYRPNIDKKPSTGNYVCRDLSCNVEIDGKTVNKKNGESWCAYEGCIGESKDPVGSRHVRHICYMGEEKTEACDDFRNQICVQSDTELTDGGKFSEAGCRVNRWRSCYEYNNEKQGMAEKCKQNPDCTIKGVHIDKFNFDVCVPNYPPGFEFWNTEDSARSGELECSFATQRCPVVYIKRMTGWKCEMNCECEKAGFSQQMNDLCVSLGDCGGYINFNGDYTDDGYSSGRAGKVNGNQYKACAKYQPNQNPAEPGDFGSSQILGIPAGVGEEDVPEADSTMAMIGGGISALSFTKFAAGIGVASKVGFSSLTFTSATGQVSKGIAALGDAWLEEGGSLISNGKEITNINQIKTAKTPSVFGNALAAIGSALSVASFMQSAFGANAEISYTVGGIYGAVVFFGPATWNPFLIWTAIIMAIVSWLAGWGKTKIKYVTFTCMPWQPPTNNGINCDLCNTNDALGVPCSEYRCKSLGQTCEFINSRTADEKCITNNPNDISSPRIKPLYKNITQSYEYKTVSDSGFELKTNNNECIPEYTLLTFGIETDKPARCRIGTDVIQTYDEMEEFFGGKNSFIIDHTMQLVAPSPSAFKNVYNLTDKEVESMGQINYFVKCENVNGISNTAPFTIRTCIKPGPDLTAPKITKTAPENNGFIKYGTTEKEIQLYTNEPADCRWSAEDKDYNLMENKMTCLSGFEDYGLYGWPCLANLTGLDTNNRFYFRCKDQPWLDDTNTSRNKMSESYIYELSVSKTPLSIIDFKPENGYEFIKGTEPVEFTLNVRTAGGAENGKAVCEWNGNGYSDQFQETYSDYYSYKITSGTRGNYNINFYCKDIAGNNASASTSFKIKIDTTGPKIIRVYFDNLLKIITDEEAECRYGFNRNFKFENATEMSGDGFEHLADWQLKTYYIQCEDEFNRKGGKTVIKAYELI